MALGSACQTNGLGSRLCAATKRLMACCRATTEGNTPRLSRRLASLANTVSTWSHGRPVLVPDRLHGGSHAARRSCGCSKALRSGLPCPFRTRPRGQPTMLCPEGYRHKVPAERVAEIERWRRQRLGIPAIARQLGMPVSTVGGVLRRLGLGKPAALAPRPPVVRCERERPGELLHIDTKELERIAAVGLRITGDRRDRKRGAGVYALPRHVSLPKGAAPGCFGMHPLSCARTVSGVEALAGRTGFSPVNSGACHTW